MWIRFVLAALALMPAGCVGTGPSAPAGSSARSAPPASQEERLLADLARARALHEAENDAESAIWVGRRLGYLGRYEEAVDWYREALNEWSDSYRLRRHLGHRLISLRRFAEAEQVLREAWELARHHPNRLEPDGAPNAYGVPRSTDHGNILYHLALAQYLQGSFEGAAEHWAEAVTRATNPDSEVSARYWLAHSLRCQGQFAEARAVLSPIGPETVVLENQVYRDLCLVMQGRMSREELLEGLDPGVGKATALYGLAAWRLQQGGDQTAALAALALVAEQGSWAAFGTIAAEADVLRVAFGESSDVSQR